MTPFLKSIAKAFVSRYPDLSEFCFIFPNKRSSTFFMKHLADETGSRPMISPQTLSISDLSEFLSGRIVDNRVDLLFILYKAYCRLSGRDDSDELSPEHLDFESFRGWGETVLSDFNEVDMYGVDADELFKNVKDIREITSNYLTEGQRKVLNEYFGYDEHSGEETGRFWKIFTPVPNPDGTEAELTYAKRKFLQLWQVLAPLYHEMHKALAESGLTTSGGALRLAADRLEEISESGAWREELPWKKVVFVGFNALTASEEKILSFFSKAPDLKVETNEGEIMDSFADFFWDGDGPFFSDKNKFSTNSRFLLSNRRVFPEPDWFLPFKKLSDPVALPGSIKIIAAPSNAAQTKIVAERVSEIRKSLNPDEEKETKVAIVLPDEGLLLPLLHSLPVDVRINLTMGYPLRLTPTMSFIFHLRILQIRSRVVRGTRSFYHGYLRRVLAHPFSHSLFGGDEIAKIIRWLDTTHRFAISPAELGAVSSVVAKYLYPLEKDASVEEVAGYIRMLLSAIAASIEKEGNGKAVKNLDTDHISLYLDALTRLTDSLDHHGIKVKGATLFSLADRLLAGEKVTFQGEPLIGLQVMGLLETRSLDFDHIIIPSMNERIFPAKARTRTFIPNSVRAGYLMPPSNYAETLSAYYFYRMISRASDVTLIYDGRSGTGLRTGDASRYLLQLRHIFAPDVVELETYTFNLNPAEPEDRPVRKSEDVAAMLEEYLHKPDDGFPSGKNRRGRVLSSTSLWNYSVCPVSFYYQNLIGLRTDDAPAEYINSMVQGNIIHSVLQNVYDPDRKSKYGAFFQNPRLIEREYLHTLIHGKGTLERMVGKAINIHIYGMEGESADVESAPLHGASAMMVNPLSAMMRRFLEYDMAQTPFEILGCEMESDILFPLPDGRKVNMRFVIDRIDRTRTREGETIRIIDYKTGTAKVTAETAGDMFNGENSSHHLFQLMLYSLLLNQWREEHGMKEVPVMPLLYSVPNVSDKNKWKPVPVVAGEEIKNHLQLKEEFEERLKGMLTEIFDYGKDFNTAQRPENCRYCQLRNLCGR